MFFLSDLLFFIVNWSDFTFMLVFLLFFFVFLSLEIIHIMSRYIYNVIGSRGVTVYSFAVGSNSFHDIVDRTELVYLIRRYKHRKHTIGLFTLVDGVVVFIDKRSFLAFNSQCSIDFNVV